MVLSVSIFPSERARSKGAGEEFRYFPGSLSSICGRRKEKEGKNRAIVLFLERVTHRRFSEAATKRDKIARGEERRYFPGILFSVWMEEERVREDGGYSLVP